jgi:hypothetical protein
MFPCLVSTTINLLMLPAPLIQIAKPTITFKTDSIAEPIAFKNILIDFKIDMIFMQMKMILSLIAKWCQTTGSKRTNFNRKGSKVLLLCS